MHRNFFIAGGSGIACVVAPPGGSFPGCTGGVSGVNEILDQGQAQILLQKDFARERRQDHTR
jgi:hypothetical protein